MTVARKNWLGKTIRELRDEAGLTQAQLAAKAGLSCRELVMRLENGQALSFPTAEKVLDALGYELDVMQK